MKYLVVSDTHGGRSALEELLYTGNYDGFIHLGDGAKEASEVSDLFPDKIFLGVTGNCDYFVQDIPDERLSRVGGVMTLLCHGHRYGVKGGLGTLAARAKGAGCRAAFFGHTHIPVVKTLGGVLLLNPGSLTYGGSYAEVTVENGELVPKLLKK